MTSLDHRRCGISCFIFESNLSFYFTCWISQEDGRKHHSVTYFVHFQDLIWKTSEIYLFPLFHFPSCVVVDVFIVRMEVQALKSIIFWLDWSCVQITRTKIARLRNATDICHDCLLKMFFFNYSLSLDFATDWYETCQSSHARDSEASPQRQKKTWFYS